MSDILLNTSNDTVEDYWPVAQGRVTLPTGEIVMCGTDKRPQQFDGVSYAIVSPTEDGTPHDEELETEAVNYAVSGLAVTRTVSGDDLPLADAKANLLALLQDTVKTVQRQGVDGPDTRSYPTDPDGWTVLLAARNGIANAGLTAPFLFRTAAGDVVGLTLAKAGQLEAAMYTQANAVGDRAATVLGLINAAANKTDLIAAKAAISTGWPTAPSNP